MNRKMCNGLHLLSLSLQQMVQKARQEADTTPKGFIPVFSWALIKTRRALQHTADAALYRVTTVFSPTFFWGGDWSPAWHMLCRGVLGQVGRLFQSSVELRHFCVLTLHLLLPTTQCSVSPTGLLATQKLPEGRSGAQQLSWATEWRKITNGKWVVNWFSGVCVWVLKRGKEEKNTQSPADHPRPAHIKGWWLVPQWPEKQTLIPYICTWTRRKRLMCNSDS